MSAPQKPEAAPKRRSAHSKSSDSAADGRRNGEKRANATYERLKTEILENRMHPGAHVTEPELAERLGVSRTPVREALIRLQGEGLVEIVPRHGVRVPLISADDMREIYEILTNLEPAAAAQLARRRPGRAELIGLEQATENMETALEEDELDAWAAADDQFHRTLLNLHGNRRLAGFVGVLLDQSHRARMMTLCLREKPEKSTAEHRSVMDHIVAGRADAAYDAFLRHRVRAATELLELLERSRLPGF